MNWGVWSDDNREIGRVVKETKQGKETGESILNKNRCTRTRLTTRALNHPSKCQVPTLTKPSHFLQHESVSFSRSTPPPPPSLLCHFFSQYSLFFLRFFVQSTNKINRRLHTCLSEGKWEVPNCRKKKLKKNKLEALVQPRHFKCTIATLSCK